MKILTISIFALLILQLISAQQPANLDKNFFYTDDLEPKVAIVVGSNYAECEHDAAVYLAKAIMKGMNQSYAGSYKIEDLVYAYGQEPFGKNLIIIGPPEANELARGMADTNTLDTATIYLSDDGTKLLLAGKTPEMTVQAISELSNWLMKELKGQSENVNLADMFRCQPSYSVENIVKAVPRGAKNLQLISTTDSLPPYAIAMANDIASYSAADYGSSADVIEAVIRIIEVKDKSKMATAYSIFNSYIASSFPSPDIVNKDEKTEYADCDVTPYTIDLLSATHANSQEKSYIFTWEKDKTLYIVGAFDEEIAASFVGALCQGGGPVGIKAQESTAGGRIALSGGIDWLMIAALIIGILVVISFVVLRKKKRKRYGLSR